MATTNGMHQSTTEHAGPHILQVSGDPVGHTTVFGYPVTTTVFSTWIFMVFLLVAVAFLYIAIRTETFPRIRAFGLDVVGRLDRFLSDALGNKKIARKFLPLV